MPRHISRADREALKHDAFFDFTSRATAFVSANMSSVLGVTGAVILAIVLAVFWSRSRATKMAESDQQASILVSNLVAGQYQNSVDLANQLQSSHRGTRAAVLADYVKGRAQLQLGNFAEAEQSFRAYLDTSSKAPFYERAAEQGLAASLEGENRFAEAAERYQASATHLQGELADEALLSAARAYRLAGDVDKARSLLQGLADKGAASARLARIELAVLDAVGPAAPVWGATIPSPTPPSTSMPGLLPATADTSGVTVSAPPPTP